MGALNAWAPWYASDSPQTPYGGDLTYELSEQWLAGLDVEDWGCGLGWFRRHHRGGYVGVDGTDSPWCDVRADLTVYRSSTPGLLLRHVLEHNVEWEAVLDNAFASFSERLCIVLFTPLADVTTVLVDDVAGLGVPDVAFRLDDLTGRFDGCEWDVETVDSPETHYGAEVVIRVARG